MKPRPTEQMLFLSQADVLALGGADMPAAIADIRRGFELFAQKAIDQPYKTILKASDGTGGVNVLSSTVKLDSGDLTALKAVTLNPHNVHRGLPQTNGLILLFDASTKAPICVMDAAVISAIRTGAVAGLAASLLANPDTTSISLIGAGVYMRALLLGIHQALPHLRKVRVYSRGESKHEFARDMAKRTGLAIMPVNSATDAVAQASFIVTCAGDPTEPIVKSADIPLNNLTIFNFGGYEVEDMAIAAMDRIVVDSWPHSKHRGGQSHAIAASTGAVDELRFENLAPIVTGAAPGRQNTTDKIYFGSVGLGFTDALIADRIHRAALSANRGTILTLRSDQSWI